MNILIVDDEPIAIGILEKYIRQVAGLEIAGSCRTAVETFNFLHQKPVDLMLLDIEMPGMTGLTLLKNLQEPPKVILTTAYREYALDGYEFDVIDYLLKPIPFERFLKAIQKARQHGGKAQMPDNRRPYLYFKSGQKMIQVYLDDILYIESLSNYVRIFLAGGTSVVTYLKMSELETTLPTADFLRIHRSYLVRKDKIGAFTAHSVEMNGKELPVGGLYKAAFLAALGQ